MSGEAPQDEPRSEERGTDERIAAAVTIRSGRLVCGHIILSSFLPNALTTGAGSLTGIVRPCGIASEGARPATRWQLRRDVRAEFDCQLFSACASAAALASVGTCACAAVASARLKLMLIVVDTSVG